MRLKRSERVQLNEAKRRALAVLRLREPIPAAVVADAIWPGHKMHAQGAGAAASRVLKALERDGMARWDRQRYPMDRWGWIKTEARTK